MVTGRTKGVTQRAKGNVILVAAQRDDGDGSPTEEYLILRSDQFGQLEMTSGGAGAMVSGRTKGVTERAVGSVVLVAAQRDDPDGNPTDEYLILRADQFGQLRVIDSAAVTTFLGLTDTPASYIGAALLGVRVNAAADALEFAAAVGGIDRSVLATKSALQSIPNNTTTVLTWDLETYDTDGMHDNVVNNSRITIQTPGKYLVWANADFLSNATGVREISLFLNAARVAITTQGVVSIGTRPSFITMRVMDLVASDFVEVLVFQTSGGSLDLISTGSAAFGAIKILG